jgi:hypothetical protein
MDQDRSKDFLLALYSHFLGANASYLEQPGRLLAGKAILLAIEQYNLDMAGIMGAPEASRRRELYLRRIIDDLTSVIENEQNRNEPWPGNVNVFLDTLAEIPFSDSEQDGEYILQLIQVRWFSFNFVVQYSRQIRKLLVQWRRDLNLAHLGSSFSGDRVSSAQNLVHLHKLLARFQVGKIPDFLDLSKQILRLEGK